MFTERFPTLERRRRGGPVVPGNARAARRNRGQALTEALVAALVLVPLAALIVMLGKYQSVQMAAIAASRTLAFECTVRIAECGDRVGQERLAAEMRDRHFTRGDRPIASAPGVTGMVAAGQSQPLWTATGGQQLLPDLGAVRAGFAWSSFDAGGSVAIGQGQSRFPSAVALLDSLAGPGRFGLALRAGLVDTRVEASLPGAAPLAARAFEAMGLTFRAHTAILTDDWSASRALGPEPDTLESRVALGQRLDPLHEAAQPLAYQLTLWSIDLMGMLSLEAKAGSFRYHHSDVSLLPPDRVAP